ncbi:hypothetical protein SK128_024021 [Halocaridina rubra]|uniref:Uncharacterized protein n=1 Tax=Halocaridina rubra TaxID=373956 RepID=A0AAN8XF61_HALRR
MTKSSSEEEEEQQPEETHEEVEESGLIIKRLAAMYSMAKKLQQLSQEHDDNMARSTKHQNDTISVPNPPSYGRESSGRGSPRDVGVGVAVRRLKQKVMELETLVINLDDKIRNMDREIKETETHRKEISFWGKGNKAQGQERKELEK